MGDTNGVFFSMHELSAETFSQLQENAVYVRGGGPRLWDWGRTKFREVFLTH